MNEVEIFINRLKKIGITIELIGNIPWIYLDKVNGNKIQREDWINANHGYTIAWYPFKLGEKPHLNWHDIKTTFKLIRKYKNYETNSSRVVDKRIRKTKTNKIR